MDTICAKEGCDNLRNRKGTYKNGTPIYGKHCYKHSHTKEFLSRRGKTPARKLYKKTRRYKFIDKERARDKATRKRNNLLGKECEICKRGTNLEMHHPDYELALEVTTLCLWCHHKVHNGRL